ncbi:hypothetical protein AS149_13750 [Burkholderia cenocepacia]|nr:hypothetical protein AS149_13750 [Burkholderia cenocepacia]
MAAPAKPQKLKLKHKRIEHTQVPEPTAEQAQAIAPPKAELLPEAAAAAAAAIAQRDHQRAAALDAPVTVSVNRIAVEQPTVRPIEDKPRVKPVPVAPVANLSPAERAADASAAAPHASQYREIGPVVAEPLVSDSKPSVVARSSSGDRAWVRLGETRTVIVSKGQAVPGLGTFQGADSKGAKFDSGYMPISQ